MNKSIFFILILWVCIMINTYASKKNELPLRFDFYHTNEEIIEALKLLHEAYPELTTLEVIGRTEEKREIYALTINNKKTGGVNDKPGMYIDGNIHGNEIQAAEVCLYLAHKLLSDYGKNETITKVVDKNAWFIIPIVNVDGRYHFFNDANTQHSNRGLRIPVDDDRDGLFDEDFPDDLDGDGNICQIRKRDPNGNYKSDPEDPRNLIRIKPGEKGEWTLLGYEGIDNDNDGLINEDSEGYVDQNRDWGYFWQPNYVQRGAGNFPLSGKGTKAIAEWLLKHQNIIMSYVFHNNGGMFLRSPSSKLQGELPSKDIAVYDYLGDNQEKIVPGYKYLIAWKDLYTTYGDFLIFIENIIGCYGFVGELSTEMAESYNKKPFIEGNDPLDLDRQRLDFNDHVAQGTLFKEWTKYNHPQYGEVEIGGWVKMSERLPHPFMLQDLVHRVSSAVIFSAEQTPDVKMEVFEKTKIKNELYRVRVRLKNDKAMPSMTYNSIKHGLYPKDVLKINGSNAIVVLGGELIDKYMNKVNYKEHKPEVQFCQVPGFGMVEYEFIINGKGNIKIEYQSRKAKNQEITLVL